MSGHTPGPWNVTPVIEGDPYPMRRMRSLNTRGMVLAHINENFDGEANAQLIAAAPKLLAALRAVVAVYDKVGGPLSVDPAVADARAAIAEAEGRPE